MSNPTDGNEQQGEALEPCPFCGVVPMLPTGRQGVWRVHYRVTCGTDNCYGNSAGISAPDANAAIKFWNTRRAPGEDGRPIVDVAKQHDFIQIKGSDRCGLRGCVLGVLEHSWIPPSTSLFPSPAEPELWTQGNRAEAIRLLRELRETTDPAEIQRQKDSWAQLETALCVAPLKSEGEYEKCPACGEVDCFDHALRTTTPPDTPSDAARAAAEDIWARINAALVASIPADLKQAFGDEVVVQIGQGAIPKIAAIITRHFAATTSPVSETRAGSDAQKS